MSSDLTADYLVAYFSEGPKDILTNRRQIFASSTTEFLSQNRKSTRPSEKSSSHGSFSIFLFRSSRGRGVKIEIREGNLFHLGRGKFERVSRGTSSFVVEIFGKRRREDRFSIPWTSHGEGRARNFIPRLRLREPSTPGN